MSNIQVAMYQNSGMALLLHKSCCETEIICSSQMMVLVGKPSKQRTSRKHIFHYYSTWISGWVMLHNGSSVLTTITHPALIHPNHYLFYFFSFYKWGAIPFIFHHRHSHLWLLLFPILPKKIGRNNYTVIRETKLFSKHHLIKWLKIGGITVARWVIVFVVYMNLMTTLTQDQLLVMGRTHVRKIKKWGENPGAI